MSSDTIAIHLLVELLDQAFDLKAWHGPNSRRDPASDGRASRLAAATGSALDRRVVVHCAYWKYAVRRKLRGDSRGGFRVKGSNWFPQSDDLSKRDWKLNIEISRRACGVAFSGGRVRSRPFAAAAPNSRYTFAFLIQGAAAHDLYHAGQIQVLKRLQP